MLELSRRMNKLVKFRGQDDLMAILQVLWLWFGLVRQSRGQNGIFHLSKEEDIKVRDQKWW
jgi:hypothetical protein